MSEETAAAGKSEAAPRRRRGWFAIIPLLVFVGLAGLFIKQLVEGGDPSLLPSALIGHEVPDFNLPPVTGVVGPDGQLPGLSSADLKAGKVTLVNVWASWCVPCREEHPWLMEMAKNHGVRLVGINYKDNPENARRLLGSMGVPFSAIGADTDGRVAINWGVYGVPETYVVDGKGVIRFKQVGPIVSDQAMNAVLAQIAKAETPLN